MKSTLKFATVGIRNQVTLPKEIRDKAGISEKIIAYIMPDNGKLIISVNEPESKNGHSRIKISAKGQFVIPKHLRNSYKIKKGINLAFRYRNNQIDVMPVRGRRSKETDVFNTVIDFLKLTHNRHVSFFNDSDGHPGLHIEIKKRLGKDMTDLTTIIQKLEDFFNLRLMIVAKLGNVVELKPLRG